MRPMPGMVGLISSNAKVRWSFFSLSRHCNANIELVNFSSYFLNSIILHPAMNVAV